MSPKKPKLPPRPRSKSARIAQAGEIYAVLSEIYPDSTCALHFRHPLELLIATVLSAQTTDVRVNSVTPTLFERYPDAEGYASAELSDLEEILRPLGFFRAKAASLQGIGRALCEKFGGEVPDTLEDLVSLPGVGRKTANVVLGNAFGVPGITVDTHVGRLARRFAWTRHTDPVKAEADIAEVLPREEWTIACHRIIDHGRAICHARKPECGRCPLAELCPSRELVQ